MWPSIDKIHNTIPASTGMNLPQFIGFIVFYVIQLPFLMISVKKLRWLVAVGSVGGSLAELSLVIWACSTRGPAGFGSVLSGKSQLSGSTTGWMFVYAITITISSITSGTLSVCDYARFAKKPSSGIWSQLAGWFPAWISNVFGILTIAATQNRYGAALWSVSSLLSKLHFGLTYFSLNPQSLELFSVLT
jgi:NCS1 family nucleobase:cation symporter-1